MPLNKDDIDIRPEITADYESIDELVVAAFGGKAELAPFVRAIRESNNYMPKYSLVAEKNGEIIGHIMLSYVELDDSGKHHRVLALSPVSVSPNMQKMGIGSKLVEEVLTRADKNGEPLVILEGHPEYYPRFGFVPATSHGITYTLPDWAPPEAAMVKILRNDDPTIKGHVVYPLAFDIVADRPVK